MAQPACAEPEQQETGASKRKADAVNNDSDQSLARKQQRANPTAPTDVPKTRVVRLKRSGGQVVQGCDVYIGRAWNAGGWKLPKSKWANPFTVAKSGGAPTAVKQYREYVLAKPELMSDLEELRGKVLGCWCKPGPCHGDVLVELLKSKDPPAP
jgi:hypothetical protein